MDNWLTTKEAAEFLKCSESTVYRLCQRNELSFTKRGIGLRIRLQDLQEWLEKGRTPKFLLTNLTPLNFNRAEGGQSELAKKKPACFYGFGRIYQRIYKSGRRCWTIEYRDESGKRIQKAIPQAQSREEAATILQQEVQKVFDRKYGIKRRREKIGFTAFSKIYLQDYAMITKKSWKTDASSLRIMNAFFKDIELREISPLAIQKFRAWRLREGNAKSTTNRYLALLKRMFTIAIDEGYAETNPVRKVKLFSERDNLRERPLFPGEEKKLLEACADHLKPIILAALNTGMRRGEILNLKWKEVDLRRKIITVEKTKSGKVRFIPINDALFHELNTLRVVSNKSPLVFSNPKTGKAYVDIKKGFKAACRRAGIENLRFHDLRHTFASRLIEKGADIATVQMLLGHSSITTTERYIHSSDARAKAAVELLGEDKVCDVFVTQGDSSKVIH